MSKIILAAAVVFTLATLGCATLDSGGERVQIVSSVDKECKNLGPVSVIVTGWGLPEESQNVLRNNTAELGGNTLVMNGGSSGIAYTCSDKSQAR